MYYPGYFYPGVTPRRGRRRGDTYRVCVRTTVAVITLTINIIKIADH